MDSLTPETCHLRCICRFYSEIRILSELAESRVDLEPQPTWVAAKHGIVQTSSTTCVVMHLQVGPGILLFCRCGADVDLRGFRD